MVEFALVAPIFLLILFGIIQLGLILGAQNSLTSAVRETARYAAPYRVVDASGAATTCQTALAKLQASLASNPLTGATAISEIPTITYTWRPNPVSVPQTYYVEITVKADYKFPLYVPLISNILQTGVFAGGRPYIRLSAQEEMRVENDPLTSSDTTTSCT